MKGKRAFCQLDLNETRRLKEMIRESRVLRPYSEKICEPGQSPGVALPDTATARKTPLTPASAGITSNEVNLREKQFSLNRASRPFDAGFF